jgi:hypothetical protein
MIFVDVGRYEVSQIDRRATFPGATAKPKFPLAGHVSRRVGISMGETKPQEEMPRRRWDAWRRTGHDFFITSYRPQSSKVGDEILHRTME